MPSHLGLCTPSKNVSFQSLKSPIPSPNPFLFERGQGDATGFMSTPPSMNGCNSHEMENCSPLLDPETRMSIYIILKINLMFIFIICLSSF